MISHTASFDEVGDAHVVDAWNSPEELDNFLQTRLGPAFQKFNVPQLQVEIYPATLWMLTLPLSRLSAKA